MRTLHLNSTIILLALVSMPTLNVFAKTINKDATQSGTERLTETLTINAQYIINGNLEVTRNITINTNGKLIINGNLTSNRDFTISDGGELIINGNLTSNGEFTVSDDSKLIINGNLTSNGDFEISGDSRITINENGELYVNKDFDAEHTTSGSIFNRTYHYPTIEVDGSMIVNGKLTSEAYLTVNGQLEAGNAEIKQDLTINGNASMVVSDKLTTNSNITVNGQLETGNAEIKQDLTISKNASMVVNGKLTANNNITVSGELEADEADIYKNLVINENASMVVHGELNDDGNIVVNGKLEAGEIFVDEKLTINKFAVLYVNKDESDSDPNGKLTIKRGGEVTFKEESIAIIEGDLEQDDNTAISIFLGNNTGTVDAQGATIVVEGNYLIYSNSFGRVDSDCEVIDPAYNAIYVFGEENQLDKVFKDPEHPTAGDRDQFDIDHKEGLKSFLNHVLPIELVYFTADEIGGGVRFAWETASELNNDYFTIEFSIDAIEFTELTTIEGAGTSTEPHFYRYSDFSSHSGIVYYRLKQTDFDGKYTYSKIVSVAFIDNQITDSYSYYIYPNPATDRISIGGGRYESISFISANGSVIRQESASGSHDITKLPKGMNFVIIHTADGDFSQRFIKR